MQQLSQNKKDKLQKRVFNMQKVDPSDMFGKHKKNKKGNGSHVKSEFVDNFSLIERMNELGIAGNSIS